MEAFYMPGLWPQHISRCEICYVQTMKRSTRKWTSFFSIGSTRYNSLFLLRRLCLFFPIGIIFKYLNTKSKHTYFSPSLFRHTHGFNSQNWQKKWAPALSSMVPTLWLKLLPALPPFQHRNSQWLLCTTAVMHYVFHILWCPFPTSLCLKPKIFRGNSFPVASLLMPQWETEKILQSQVT